MPRIKRWFPVSHDINSDPEVWTMRREIGEKSLSIWLEMLSISDRNESELPGDYQALVRSIAGKCQATVRTVSAVFEFAKTRLWVISQPTLRVSNYSKYHVSRDANQIPRGKQSASLPSEPSYPSEPNLIKKEKKKSKSQLPDGFAVSEAVTKWGAENGIDPTQHLEAFRDHHTAKASLFADWDAAFRTWLRNSKRFGNGNGKAETKEDHLKEKTARILRQGL